MLNHDNIVRFFGHRKEGSTVYLFLEYCTGGELFDRIGETNGSYFLIKSLIIMSEWGYQYTTSSLVFSFNNAVNMSSNTIINIVLDLTVSVM